MALPIVNSIISWFLKKRVHQIELFLKYPIDVQEELLMKLIATAKRTELGKEYHFSSIKIMKILRKTYLFKNMKA